jgi:integrase
MLVPLSPWALREFQALKRAAGRGRWVLPSLSDASKHTHPSLLTGGLVRHRARFEQAGIKQFSLHDLRRTCRTNLSRLKVKPHIAEAVLGHAKKKIHGTYDTWAYLDEKRAALDLWAQHLEQLKASKPASAAGKK